MCVTHAGSARQPVTQAPSSPEVELEIGADPDIKYARTGSGFYNNSDLYKHLKPLLKPGPAAVADGDCMFDSLRILLSRNNIQRADGEAWDVPSLRKVATQAAQREWEHAQSNDREKRRLQGKLLSIIELQRKFSSSLQNDIEAYFERMQVPCNPSKYKMKVPHGLRGLWGDSHILHALADALGIVVVTMTASPSCMAWLLGKKGVNLATQVPECIVYLHHDGYSHYNTLVPTGGDAADSMVRQAMAGALPAFVPGTTVTSGLPSHAKSTRSRDRLR